MFTWRLSLDPDSFGGFKNANGWITAAVVGKVQLAVYGSEMHLRLKRHVSAVQPEQFPMWGGPEWP